MRAALFDAAGTLIELCEPVGETYSRLAREHGVDLPAWRVSDAHARIVRAAPPMVFPDAPRERRAALEKAWWRDVVRGTFRASDGRARFRDFDAYFDRLYAHYASPGAWRARPGAASALGALRRRGLATGVVSNFDQRLPPILEDLGLAGLLDAVVLPAEAGAAKPEAAIFLFAVARLGVVAGETVFVGDDAERDLAGARRAGLHAIDVGELATLAELPERIAHIGCPRPAQRGVDA